MSFDPKNKPHQLLNNETIHPSTTILEVSPSEYVESFRGDSASESLQKNINWYWQKFLAWFANLSTKTKFVVGILGLVFGYAMAQAILKLVASIIGVALLLVLVYLGYKFLVSGVEQNQH
jgi:hypothetical protein